MSVLIRGMKMPSGCISCDLCNTFTDEPYCRRLMRKTPKATRLKDCPLVEVPPHGRLIDADDAFIDADERGFDFWSSDADIDSAQEFLRAQPTFIEAEEGEAHDA